MPAPLRRVDLPRTTFFGRPLGRRTHRALPGRVADYALLLGAATVVGLVIGQVLTAWVIAFVGPGRISDPIGSPPAALRPAVPPTIGSPPTVLSWATTPNTSIPHSWRSC